MNGTTFKRQYVDDATGKSWRFSLSLDGFTFSISTPVYWPATMDNINRGYESQMSEDSSQDMTETSQGGAQTTRQPSAIVSASRTS